MEKEIKPKKFNWGKLSFLLGVFSVVTVALYWLFLWDFHRNYPSGGIIDLNIFIFCFLATPIIAVANSILILVCSISFKYKEYKYYFLSSFVLSLIVFGLWSLYFLLYLIFN